MKEQRSILVSIVFFCEYGFLWWRQGGLAPPYMLLIGGLVVRGPVVSGQWSCGQVVFEVCKSTFRLSRLLAMP